MAMILIDFEKSSFLEQLFQFHQESLLSKKFTKFSPKNLQNFLQKS